MSSAEEGVDTEEAYAELINIYPDNPLYLRRYAELLIEVGREATATEILRRLHDLYTKKGDLSKAEALTREFPQTGRVTDFAEAEKGDQRPFLRLVEGGVSRRLWLRMNQRKLIEGEHLFRSGDLGDGLFLILEGEIAIVEKSAKGSPIFIETLCRGELAGVLAFLSESDTRISEAIANKPSVVIEITRKRMVEFLAEYPRLRNELEKSGEHIEMVRRISVSPLLQQFPLAVRQFLAREAKVSHYGKGETVSLAGKKSDYIDILVEGSIAFTFSDPSGKSHQVGVLRTGAFIGDVSGRDGGALPADVVTLDQVTFVRVSRSAIANIAEAHPALHESLLKYGDNLLAQLIEKLRDLGLFS